ELEWRYGCLFDRTREGRIHQKPFAGQSHDRTIHKGDLTGIEIMNRLAEQTQARPNITGLEECRAVELLRDDAGRAAGALVLDIRTGRFIAVAARVTLLATGGGPTMYRVIACSADKAADGLALAYRAGLSPRAGVVEKNFRRMVKRCRDFGRDLARGPVEVGPTTHFMMGGVVIDTTCRTAIEGLFAAGEDTGGVHGANRLGGNGVAESTVFGGIAGDVMADFVAGRSTSRHGDVAVRAVIERLTAPLARRGGDLYGLQRELREVMWERAGLVRDGEGLKAAVAAAER